MKVFEVTDGMLIQQNCTYIIPPNSDLSLKGNTLHLSPPVEPRGKRLPIDFLFNSLAETLGDRSICIVLSGTGSDGTQGVRAIKDAGGMAMAQNPASAEFDGMPQSAIWTQLLDYILPPAEMPEALMRYATSLFHKKSGEPQSMISHKNDNYKKIFALLRMQTGHDLSQYKFSTIQRRIERRMTIHQIKGLSEYLHFLETTADEVDALFHELLIGVTRFFRDEEAFSAVEKEVMPRLFSGKNTDKPVRVWSTGCSTGEEAYSIAMIIKEYTEAHKLENPIQIFATDIDNHAIQKARIGRYPSGIINDMSAERLQRFFTVDADGSYQVKKTLRDMLIFSDQDVLADPPFSKLDFVICRNLMIYLNRDLQHKLIALFHYAMVTDGVLFLGTSESIGNHELLFARLNPKMKLFLKKESHTHGALSQLIPRNLKLNKPIGSIVSPKPQTQTNGLASLLNAPDFTAPLQKQQADHENDSNSIKVVNDELISSNTELKIMNEEMQSVNEELQSVNEELETSKEELQSVNEELSTVNAELQSKITDLSQANNDMNNLLTATGIATLFVDCSQRIMRFTPAISSIINLIPSDAGRPMSHISNNLSEHYPLLADTKYVLDTLKPIEKEVRMDDGNWFTLRILPYRTIENVVEGAVLTFVNITETVRIRETLRKVNSLLRLTVVVNDSNDALTVQDLQGMTLAWNHAATKIYGWTETEALQLNIRDRIPIAHVEEELKMMQDAANGSILDPYLSERLTNTGFTIKVMITATALMNEDGQIYAIATTEQHPIK